MLATINNAPTLMLMTKSPIPGEVKTRLHTHVSAKTAAAIAMMMIEDTVEIVSQNWPGKTQLLVSPNIDHPSLQELANTHQIPLAVQAPGDLGSKMEAALQRGLKSAPAAAIMGCDIPDVSGQILKATYQRLTEGSNVLGPTADGGFYMIGLRHCLSNIFSGIAWSTPSVLEIVLDRLRQDSATRIDFLLPCLQDIDCWQDFEHYGKQHSKYQTFL